MNGGERFDTVVVRAKPMAHVRISFKDLAHPVGVATP